MPKRCTLSPVGTHKIESDTTTKTYEVIIRSDGKHTCNCTGFVTKRNKLGGYVALGMPECTCKHVRNVLQSHTCGWTSASEIPQEYPHICPMCQSNTEDYDEPAPAQLDDAAVNDALDGLLSLHKRLKAK